MSRPNVFSGFSCYSFTSIIGYLIFFGTTGTDCSSTFGADGVSTTALGSYGNFGNSTGFGNFGYSTCSGNFGYSTGFGNSTLGGGGRGMLFKPCLKT